MKVIRPEEKIIAIKGSIKKWECLCAGETKLIEAINLCDLCIHTDKRSGRIDCDICPLKEIKQKCFDGGYESTFHKIYEEITTCRTFSCSSTLANKPELCDLFEEMLEHVSSLLD